MKTKVLFSLLLSAVLIGTASCAGGRGGRGGRGGDSTSAAPTSQGGTSQGGTSQGGTSQTGTSQAGTSESGTSQSGEVPERIWKTAFGGCIKLGGSTSATAISDTDPTASNALTPATTKNGGGLFVVCETSKNFTPLGSPEAYHMDIEYEFSATVNGAAANYQDYVESKVDTSETGSTGITNKSTFFFKNWPASGSPVESYPMLTVTAKGTINGQSQSRTFNLVLNPYDVKYKQIELKDLYKTGENCLDWMTADFVPFKQQAKVDGAYGPDYKKYDEWSYDESKKSGIANVETYGKITYAAEDGNSGILQCGEYALQLYQLGTYAGWSATKTALMNVDVVVRGSLSGGYGNIQFSYIDEVIPLTADYGHTVDAIAERGEITEAMISNVSWWSYPIFNKIVKPTTVTFQGNVKELWNHSQGADSERKDLEKDIDFAAIRYEFDVKLGDTTISIQTDYHMTKDSPELCETLKSIVTSSVGTSIKIGGTIRWLNDVSKVKCNDYSTRSTGIWQVVPYLVDHATIN